MYKGPFWDTELLGVDHSVAKGDVDIRDREAIWAAIFFQNAQKVFDLLGGI